jgi:hypothetical protein
MLIGLLARPKRFELLTPGFVVRLRPENHDQRIFEGDSAAARCATAAYQARRRLLEQHLSSQIPASPLRSLPALVLAKNTSTAKT